VFLLDYPVRYIGCNPWPR